MSGNLSTNCLKVTNVDELCENPTRSQFGGKYFVTGPFTTCSRNRKLSVHDQLQGCFRQYVLLRSTTEAQRHCDMPSAVWNPSHQIAWRVTIEHLHTSRDQQLTLSSLSGPFVARMLSFWSSCTINPQNLLNVLGSRTDGLTCIRTFLCVCMNRPYTHVQQDPSQLLNKIMLAWCSSPCLEQTKHAGPQLYASGRAMCHKQKH